jgi:hypothetical protein
MQPPERSGVQKTGKLPPGGAPQGLRLRVGEQARKVMDEAGGGSHRQVDPGAGGCARKDAQGGKLTEPEVAGRDAALKAVRDASTSTRPTSAAGDAKTAEREGRN